MEKKKILIADRDSKFILKAIDVLIEKYELYVAFSKQEVYKKVNLNIPDLIILGFLEPWGDSYSLLKEFSNNIKTKGIFFLIIDATQENYIKLTENKVEYPKIYANGYLPRSISPHELREEVKRIIELSLSKKKVLSDPCKEITGTMKTSIHYVENQNIL